MSPVLIQTALLLMLGQVLLGAAGYAVSRTGYPWLGLPLLLVYGWLIVRTGRVLRTEMAGHALRNKTQAVPLKMALGVVPLWQFPAVLLLLPVWGRMPAWVSGVWNGLMVPVQATWELWQPGVAANAEYWFTGGIAAAVALFVAVAGRPAQWVVAVAPGEPKRALAPAAGEWAPARSHKDVQRGSRNGTRKRK